MVGCLNFLRTRLCSDSGGKIDVWNPRLFCVRYARFSFEQRCRVVLVVVGHLVLETNTRLELLNHVALETNNNFDSKCEENGLQVWLLLEKFLRFPEIHSYSLNICA